MFKSLKFIIISFHLLKCGTSFSYCHSYNLDSSRCTSLVYEYGPPKPWINQILRNTLFQSVKRKLSSWQINDDWIAMFSSSSQNDCTIFCEQFNLFIRDEQVQKGCPSLFDVPTMVEHTLSGIHAFLRESKFQQDKKSAEEIIHGTMAVHATSYFPAHAMIKIARKSKIGLFRPRVHFALGGLVKEHQWGSWENQPIGILIPLQEITSQLVNISPMDTTTLGDLPIPAGSIIVADKNKFDLSQFTDKEFKHIKIEFFDSKDETLRKAIDRTLKSHGKLVFQNEAGQNNSQFTNIRSYFPLLQKNRHITYSLGDQNFSFFGQSGHYGQIETDLGSLFSTPALKNSVEGLLSQGPKTIREMEFLLFNIQKGLKAINSILEAINYPPESKQVYHLVKDDVIKRLEIAQLEIELRKKGKSIFLSSREIVVKIFELRDDMELLKKFVQENYNSLQSFTIENERPFDPRIAFFRIILKLQNNDPKSVVSLFKKFPDVEELHWKRQIPQFKIVHLQLSDGLFAFYSHSGIFIKSSNKWCLTHAGYSAMQDHYPSHAKILRPGDCFMAEKEENLAPYKSSFPGDHLSY